MWSHARKPENEVICMLSFSVLWVCTNLDSCYCEISQQVQGFNGTEISCVVFCFSELLIVKR